jgi:hypothetical protein
VGFLTKVFGKHSLDDRLLSGELSPETGEGRERAEQLLGPHHRELCAKALRDLVEEAQKPAASLFNANLRVKRLAIRENQALILTLARELEELPAVDPRGVILADRLVTDGASPVYGIAEDEGQILAAVERAREALKAS